MFQEPFEPVEFEGKDTKIASDKEDAGTPQSFPNRSLPVEPRGAWEPRALQKTQYRKVQRGFPTEKPPEETEAEESIDNDILESTEAEKEANLQDTEETSDSKEVRDEDRTNANGVGGKQDHKKRKPMSMPSMITKLWRDRDHVLLSFLWTWGVGRTSLAFWYRDKDMDKEAVLVQLHLVNRQEWG